MKLDIEQILCKWPFEPGQLNVREVEADDGRRIIQVRVMLGLLQFETTGRPDGARPGGKDSLLAYVESEREKFTAEGGEKGDFRINGEQAAALREEAGMHHHRFVACMSLEDYSGVMVDTAHNLRIFDFCAAHAEAAQDREVLEQFRTQVIATQARACAAQAVRDGRAKVALEAIDRAIEMILSSVSNSDQAEPPEIGLLQGMRDALVPRLPSSQRHELEQRLLAAIEAENYELAAVLRDELRLMM